MIIVDANIVAPLLMRGQYAEHIDRVLERDGDWLVPDIFWVEIRSALLSHIRAGELSLERARAHIRTAPSLVIRPQEYGYVDPDDADALPDVLDVAIEYSLSAYDAIYLALARRLETPLVTLDQRLLRNAPDFAISPQDFLEL